MRISDWSSDVCSSDLGAIVTNYLQNAARQKIEGVDVAADYTLPLDERSVLHFNGSASYLQSEQQIGPLQSVVQLAGMIFRPPHWRANASVEWQRSDITLAGVFKYIGGSTDYRIQTTVNVDTFKTFDIIARTSLSQKHGPLKGGSINLDRKRTRLKA